jgi:hypothetical protein
LDAYGKKYKSPRRLTPREKILNYRKVKFVSNGKRTGSIMFTRRKIHNAKRPGPMLALALIVAAMMLAQCQVSRRIAYNSYYGRPIVAAPDLICTTFHRQRLWYILYGAYSLGRPDVARIFAAERNSVRVVETKTGGDIAISALLGFFTSITAASLEYQTCAAPRQPEAPPPPKPDFVPGAR